MRKDKTHNSPNISIPMAETPHPSRPIAITEYSSEQAENHNQDAVLLMHASGNNTSKPTSETQNTTLPATEAHISEPKKSKVAMNDTGKASTNVKKNKKAIDKDKKSALNVSESMAAFKNKKSNKVKATEQVLKQEKAEKVKKSKLIRDSFTFPKDEYEQLNEIKSRLLKLGLGSKKTEIIRAAIRNFMQLTDPQLLNAMAQIPSIKTGRPTK